MEASKGSYSQTLLRLRGWSTRVTCRKETQRKAEWRGTQQGLESGCPLRAGVRDIDIYIYFFALT
jgi:hypothetical protein